MPVATLHLRFDIDTVTCMRRGVPWLMTFAEETGLRFSFFANMGQAVSYPALLRRKACLDSGNAGEKAAHLTPRQKLGWRDYLVTAVINPPVGLSSPETLQRVQAQGHDLGLHGGRNHGAWQHDGLRWSSEKIGREVDWGVSAMARAGLSTPTLFASPGFTSPPELPAVLADRGFAWLADAHREGEDARVDVSATDPLRSVNTGLAGEPGGVGYFEHLYARGETPETVRSFLTPYLEQGGHFICYDHPGFVAGAGQALFRATVRAWREAGGTIAPISALPLT